MRHLTTRPDQNLFNHYFLRHPPTWSNPLAQEDVSFLKIGLFNSLQWIIFSGFSSFKKWWHLKFYSLMVELFNTFVKKFFICIFYFIHTRIYVYNVIIDIFTSWLPDKYFLLINFIKSIKKTYIFSVKKLTKIDRWGLMFQWHQ